MELTPDQLAEYRSPFDDLVGVRLLSASGERVEAELDVRPEHLQPGGVVHGGVYATAIEGTASIGALLWLDGDGIPVGISNHTDFLRQVRDGALRFEATPVQRGRTMQLWTVDATDADGRIVAHGRVRLYTLRPEQRRPPGPQAS